MRRGSASTGHCLLAALVVAVVFPLGAAAASTRVDFAVDQPASLFNGVYHTVDRTEDFSTTVGGTLSARFHQGVSEVTRVDIIEVDLHAADVVQAEVALRGARLVANATTGWIGSGEELIESYFVQRGYEGEASGTFAYLTAIAGQSISGSLDLGLEGPLRGDFAVHFNREAPNLDLRIPINLVKTVNAGLGPLNPTFTLTGEIVARVVAVTPDPETGEIVDYLLGIEPETGNLDVNRDGPIDAADLVRNVNEMR